MAEDWRVTVTLSEAEDAGALLARLREHEAGEAPDRRVAVSADGPHVYLYADTEAAARAADGAVREELGAESLHGDIALDRWHRASVGRGRAGFA